MLMILNIFTLLLLIISACLMLFWVHYCQSPCCLSLCLSVTLVSHAYVVQDTKIKIALYDRAMFLVSSGQISWSFLV